MKRTSFFRWVFLIKEQCFTTFSQWNTKDKAAMKRWAVIRSLQSISNDGQLYLKSKESLVFSKALCLSHLTHEWMAHVKRKHETRSASFLLHLSSSTWELRECLCLHFLANKQKLFKKGRRKLVFGVFDYHIRLTLLLLISP